MSSSMNSHSISAISSSSRHGSTLHPSSALACQALLYFPVSSWTHLQWLALVHVGVRCKVPAKIAVGARHPFPGKDELQVERVEVFSVHTVGIVSWQPDGTFTTGLPRYHGLR